MMLLNERVMPEHGHHDEEHTSPNLHEDGPDAFGLLCTYVGAQPQAPLVGIEPYEQHTQLPYWQGRIQMGYKYS